MASQRLFSETREEIQQFIAELEASEDHGVNDREELIKRLKRWNDQLQKQEKSSSDNQFRLQERMRELKCLYGVIDCLQLNRFDLDNALQKVVDVIPIGFMEPKKTSAKLKVGSLVCTTAGFKPSDRDLVSSFILEDGMPMELRVGKNRGAESPPGPLFLEEEKTLLEKIARLLNRFYGHYYSTVKLADSEKKFRSVVEGAPDPIFIQADGRFVYLNMPAVHLYGADSVDQLIGKPVMDRFHPDYHEKIRKRIRRLTEKRKPVEERMEHIHLKLDGTQVWVETVGTPIEYEEKTGALVFVREITRRKKAEHELRESESRYRSLFENNHMAMFIVNPKDGSIVDVNPAVESYYGWSRKQLRSMKVTDINVLSQDEVLDGINKALKRQRNPFHYKHRLSDGSVRDVEIYSGPIIIRKQKLLYSIVIDITDRLKYEQMVRANLKEKEVLIAEIHHRVKNNMAVISGLLGLELHRNESPELREILRKTDSRIRSMALIHEKLYQAESLSEIDFGPYMQELAGHIRDYFEDQKNVAIEFEGENVRLDIIRAVPCGIIVNELITNGLKHAFKKQNKGVINLRLVETEGEIRLQYRDDGSGFDDEFLEEFRSGRLNSLGFQLISGLARQLRGQLILKNRKGALVEIRFSREMPVDHS